MERNHFLEQHDPVRITAVKKQIRTSQSNRAQIENDRILQIWWERQHSGENLTEIWINSPLINGCAAQMTTSLWLRRRAAFWFLLYLTWNIQVQHFSVFGQMMWTATNDRVWGVPENSRWMSDFDRWSYDNRKKRKHIWDNVILKRVDSFLLPELKPTWISTTRCRNKSAL